MPHNVFSAEPAHLVVIDNRVEHAVILDEPDRGVIIHPDVPACPDRQFGIVREIANAAFFFSPCNQASVISALGNNLIIAAPDMLGHFWIAVEIVLAFLEQDACSPRVVLKVDPQDNRIVWRLCAPEELVDRIAFIARVPREPDFRAFLTDRGAKQSQAFVAERLGFFDPGNVEVFQRLDVLGVVVLHPLEHDQRAVGAAYLVLLDIEELAEAELLDLVYQKLADRIPDCHLHFADTGSAGFLGPAGQDHLLSEVVRLSSAASAVKRFVSALAEQRPVDSRNLPINRRRQN